jgi:uncharacterized protein YndB with AHSA1/START domain
MTNSAVSKGTGRTLDEWFVVIERAGKTSAPHKEIADFLHEEHGVGYWWAQELTVEYEKHVGRRVLGQTQDGLFQVGVSKTLRAPAAAVWRLLDSPEGVALLTAETPDAPESQPSPEADGPLAALDASGGNGIHAKATTYRAGSHVRMQWQHPEWPSYSILQVRVTPKSKDSCVLAFHQEKLPSEKARQAMRERWRAVAALVAATAGGGDPADR